jgi:predicted nucleotidyltransferase
MKSLAEITSIIQSHKSEFAEKYGVSEIGVFGSVVRGEAREGSDLDVLVSFDRPVSFFGIMDLEFQLEELVESKVDLVMKRSLKPRIGKHILQEVVMI